MFLFFCRAPWVDWADENKILTVGQVAVCVCIFAKETWRGLQFTVIVKNKQLYVTQSQSSYTAEHSGLIHVIALLYISLATLYLELG